MSTITSSSFVKSDADNTVVLLGASCTKLISEFTTTIDDSNYVKKTGQNLQVFEKNLRKGNVLKEVSEDDGNYITRGYAESKYVCICQWFYQKDGINQQVLLEKGSTKLLSDFTSGSVDDTNFVKKTGQATQLIEGNLIRSGSEISFENLQPFQYITKQDVKYEFVQKERQYVQEIEGKSDNSFVDPFSNSTC
ncbi:MAG: hypothetical protein EZS28_053937 [Streblomastix strix]|uniref:Uncharacterized protein n=1 Tax=Streblomastix strix TaxID=222440 RepID=A0A5J4R1I8_9EUKA|nr:MAG: hypothetical protein EZS28_053937 [Streblomastix strix]